MSERFSRIKRMKLVVSFIVCIFILHTHFLIIQTGLIPNANPDVDKRVWADNNLEKSKTIVEGVILDRKGRNITVEKEPGEAAEILYPEAYSSVVGYNSLIYGKSGLRQKYAEQLFHSKNDKHTPVIELTLDNDLQQFCYKELGENVGSISIINNKTGELLCLSSRGDEKTEFNANEVDKNYDTYESIDGFYLHRALLAQDPPGSTFKIITAATLISEGKEDLVINDTGEYNGIHNAGNAAYGEIGLTKAMCVSSNVYFANAGITTGGKALERMAKNFQIGKKLELDFASISSEINMEYYGNEIVEQTAFGQGNTQISPLHIAMTLQTVVNNGEMIRPYIIKDYQGNAKRKRFKSGKYVLGEPIHRSDSKKLKKVLHNVATEYGFSEDEFGKVFAKTGTAQINQKGNPCHIYLVFATEKITGIISMDRTDQSSHSLIPIAKNILLFMKQNKIE